jgi:hypothetical protein
MWGLFLKTGCERYMHFRSYFAQQILSFKKQGLIVGVVVCINVNVDAATITSTASGGNWSSTSSWVGAKVPTSVDDVIIAAGATVTVNVTTTIHNLQVKGTLRMNDAITLSVLGSMEVTATGVFQMPGGSGDATLLVYGDYTNYGDSYFEKSTVIIGGDFSSPSGSAVQNNGRIVIGGNAIGTIDVSGSGSNQVFPINPNATVVISPTKVDPNPVPPADLTNLINTVIYGGTCGFTVSAPSNSSVCEGGTATFSISSNATSPSYQWEKEVNGAWQALAADATYSGVYTAALTVNNALLALNGSRYRCKVTASSCSKAGNYASLTVTASTLTTSIAVNETSGLTNNDGTICQGASAVITASGGTSYLWSNGATSSSITTGVAGTYSVKVSDASCSVTLSKTIAVLTSPTPSITSVDNSGISNDAILCLGGQVTLTASGGTSYAWQGGPATSAYTDVPAATRNYSVVVTDNVGCSAPDTGFLYRKPNL